MVDGFELGDLAPVELVLVDTLAVVDLRGPNDGLPFGGVCEALVVAFLGSKLTVRSDNSFSLNGPYWPGVQ